MPLKQIKGVLAIPPQEAGALPAGRELTGDQLEAFRKAGWRFFATEEFARADVEPGAEDFREIAAEKPESRSRAATGQALPRRVYRDAAGRVVIEGASIVVKFEPGVARPRVDEILRAHDVRVRSELRFTANSYQVEPEAPAATDLMELADRLQALDEVTYAEPNQVEAFEPR